MKKIIFTLGFLFSGAVFAITPIQDLKDRLSKIDAFNAHFSQEVISPEKEVLVAGKGEIWLSRPNLFRWHTKTPDENIIVSDGKTLWYYNPFVEQVTATWLEDSTDQTPFVLIVRNNEKDWNKYDIVQKQNEFTLTAKDNTNNMPTFVIEVTKDGIIKTILLIEQDGQQSVFNLMDFHKGKVDKEIFKFELPEFVELDDQRAH